MALCSYSIDCGLGASSWQPLWAESISGLEMQLGGGPVSVASSAGGGPRADRLLALCGAAAVRLLDVSSGEVIWGGDFDALAADASRYAEIATPRGEVFTLRPINLNGRMLNLGPRRDF